MALPSITWSSDRTLRIALGESISPEAHARVREAFERLRRANLPHALDITPAYTTLCISFEALPLTRENAADSLATTIARLLNDAQGSAPIPPPRLVTIPVCYDASFAPDLDHVASHAGLSIKQVIRLHSSATYTVHFLGFSPGFAYLHGLPTPLHIPRLESPRTSVPAGSVAIAGAQAGIYPHSTPGGWRILARTPLTLFDPLRDEPSLLRTGDLVRFAPISAAEFETLERDARSNPASRPSHAPHSQVRHQSPAMRILKPGLRTTIQDLGRRGSTHLGVAPSGAADPLSLILANRLLSNPDNAAALECTLLGPTIEFLEDAVVVVTGADMAIVLEQPSGRLVELPRYSPFSVSRGEILRLAHSRGTARAYIAFAGGIDVPCVLASRSTHAASAMGGLEGRPLRDADLISLLRPRSAPRSMPDALRDTVLAPLPTKLLRVTPGPHHELFSDQQRQSFFSATFSMSERSDRSGLRLVPTSPLPLAATGSLASEPTVPGAVQVPPSGEPIILGPDGPTTGGYPVIASVASIDLPLLGQLRPRDLVSFVPISKSQARSLLARFWNLIDEHLPPATQP